METARVADKNSHDRSSQQFADVLTVAMASANGSTAAQTVLSAYDAYNSRDVTRLLGFLSEDVDWPDGDRRLRGRQVIKQYWLNQWTCTETRDTPTNVTLLPDGRVNVHLDQVVHSVDGKELSRGSFEYLFELRNDLIVRLDIVMKD